MDTKELRAEAVPTEHGSDGGAKFALQYDRSKSHDTGTGAFKGDTAGSRPCAVIGPDRAVPLARDYPKKAPVEPWITADPVYRRLSDYPHKMSDNKDPTRNISPRQTFQENMQRIIMPPGYNAMKLQEDPPYASKNNKLNVPLEVKYCEVPYSINPTSSDQKHIRNSDHSASNVNPLLMRGAPHGWPAGSVNVRPLRPYGAPEVLQYPDYTNCTGPRPVLTRTHASGHEELQQMYPEPYYHESNVRFKPYPNIKERYPQTRYEYLGNYPNPYHPPHPFAHKFELPKTMPTHTYAGYPPVPVKYTERVPEPVLDGYQRTFSQQGNYGVPIRNPVIHPPYRPVPQPNHMQGKLHPYPPDGQHKPPVPNKLPYDPNSKMYLDYDPRSRPLPVTDNYYLNELPRSYHAKNTIVLPNYTSASMHGVNTHPYYIKENMPMKNYEYSRFKNMDPSMINHSLTKLPPQFSPSTLAISPAESNASNETTQTHGTLQEDCGYVSQSSITSVRSIESLNRIPVDPYGRYDYRYGPIVRGSSTCKTDPSNQESKTKKDIRQFIASWSEGDDENAENSAKRDGVKTISDDKHTFNKRYETVNNQEQLYVLGLVNVPSEELSKYEHIQKVSKLPENIKGYNSLELLNQFEEAIESSNITSVKPPTPRTIQMPLNSLQHKHDPIPRSVSPLDVEAKISQSVIHKDVGCNFEIKPCSPKMLNVEVATPMTLINERVIEKVANPLNIKTPVLKGVDENIDSTLISKSMKCSIPNTTSSCKLINNQHLSESSAMDHLKTNYSLHDLESNSGVCLASLPRLDTDIELNFPEVNQQFINANKSESVISTSFTKDLPALDVDQSDNNTLKNTISGTEYDMNYQFSPKMDTETDFSRLSKYRKLKRRIPDGLELAKAQATRVDSVIIKNPDNIRSVDESADTSISGNYDRNDSQEFAMNLVSEAKNSKANQRHEVDKMFDTSTSTASTNSYDEISFDSRSNLALHKSFNVTEEKNRNIVNIQSESLSLHSKERMSTIDIPMNLSPQAKYSIAGADEEIRCNISSDKSRHHDITSDISLDKIDNQIIDENLSVSSNIQCHNIREEPIMNFGIADCPSSDFSKEGDNVEIDKTDQMVTYIDQVHTPPIKNTYNIEAPVVQIKQNNELDTKETVDTSSFKGRNQVNNLLGKTELSGNAPKVGCTDKINSKKTIDCLRKEHDNLSKIGRKKYNFKLHLSKSKRKKYRSEVGTHRKRGAERKSVGIVERKGINYKTEHNLKLTTSCKGGDPSRQATFEESIPVVIPEEKNNSVSSACSKECIETVKNETITSDSEYIALESKALEADIVSKNFNRDNNINAVNENVKKICRDLITDDIPSKQEKEAITENVLPMDIDREVTRHDEKNTSHMPMPTIINLCLDGPVIKSKNARPKEILPLDQCETDRKSLLQHTAIGNFEDKNLDTSVTSDQDGNQSKKEQNNERSNFEKKESTMPLPSNQNEELSKGKPKCQDLDHYKSEDFYQDTQTLNTENPSVCQEHDVKERFGEEKTIKQYNNKKSAHRAHVNKELFSSRFQNLLTYNENCGTYSGVGEPILSGTQLTPPKPAMVRYDHEIQDPEICPNLDTVAFINSTKSDNETCYLGDTIDDVMLNSCNTIDRNNSEADMSKNKNDYVVSAEETLILNVPNNADEGTGNEIHINNIKTNLISEMQSNSYDIPTKSEWKGSINEQQVIANVDTSLTPINNVVGKSSSENIPNDYDNYLETNNSDRELDSKDNNKANIIVIDETASLTAEHFNEDRKNSTFSVSNYEFDKKLQSFSRSLRGRPRFSLKRSLSDSALDTYDDELEDCTEKRCFMMPKKRKKVTDIDNINESHLLNIIQSSRRNSISTLSNENFSLCIVIDDNCIVDEENYEQENDYIQLKDDASTYSPKDPTVEEVENTSAIYTTVDHNNCDTYTTKCDEEKTWVEDVGCEETIETEDIAENIVIGEPTSPKDTDLSDYESDDEDMDILNNDAVDHTSKVKHIYGDNMCTNDAQLVDALYRTPQMDVNKTLMDRESQINEKGNKYYDSESLEMLLAEPIDNISLNAAESNADCNIFSSVQESNKEDKVSTCLEVMSPLINNLNDILTNIPVSNEESIESIKRIVEPSVCDDAQDGTVHSCESSLDNVFSYIHKGDSSFTSSSSPEVSSTTSEEKNSSILLKISNFKGSRVSEVKNLTYVKQKENSCKFTEKEYLNPNYNNGMSTNRPLLTKAAQKYIPPLREVPDLKVKLALPQQSLLKLQKNKVAKEEPKYSTSNNKNIKSHKEIPRKIKPKFEDVLKNIDEVQFQRHKDKNKKPKKYIPKVVIKKSENGSHYASTSTKQTFNPDLTGRKWQPWVFIEKNQFIDKMALRNKTRAVFSHRRKSYVLAEKFCKYKSISSAKFIISQPKVNDFATGNLKYTIKLKHTYSSKV